MNSRTVLNFRALEKNLNRQKKKKSRTKENRMEWSKGKRQGQKKNTEIKRKSNQKMYLYTQENIYF